MAHDDLFAQRDRCPGGPVLLRPMEIDQLNLRPPRQQDVNDTDTVVVRTTRANPEAQRNWQENIMSTPTSTPKRTNSTSSLAQRFRTTLRLPSSTALMALLYPAFAGW